MKKELTLLIPQIVWPKDPDDISLVHKFIALVNELKRLKC